jgi:hypothetical protein
MIVGMSGEAFAQGHGWEVEVHGGGAFVTNLTGGTRTLPSSTPLATPAPQFPSRRVSTWFAGAGSTLANEVAGLFAVSGRITPLDAILNQPLGERGNGGSVGFRVSRVLTPRFSAEFNFDYAATSLEVPSAVSSGVQTTATSFKATFDGYLAVPPFGTANFPSSVTSSGSVAGGGGSQILATGAITYNLLTAGKFIPYATGGFGVISDGGDAPSAQIDGQYSVRILTTPWIEETDRVSFAYDADDKVFVGVLGGGVKVQLSPRSGIRGDVRVHLGSRTVRTLLDANPSVRISTAQLAAVIGTPTNPSIVFSNNPTVTNFSSSLSGPALDGFEAYTVDGMVTQTLVSAGYFFRF